MTAQLELLAIPARKRPERPAGIPDGGTVLEDGARRLFVLSHGWDYAVCHVIGEGPIRVPWSDWAEFSPAWTVRPHSSR